MSIEVNYKGKNCKNTNMWSLNNMLLNNQQVTEEIKEEIKKILGDKLKQKHNNPQSMGPSKSNFKR